jgi:hypothetical protein
MALILSGSIKLTDIPQGKIITGKNGKYAGLTISINNEPDKFGNNASIVLSQTKEERDAKEPKVYLGNCKLVWTDGVCPDVPAKDGAPAPRTNKQAAKHDDDLPF